MRRRNAYLRQESNQDNGCNKFTHIVWFKNHHDKYILYIIKNKGCEKGQKLLPQDPFAVGKELLFPENIAGESIFVCTVIEIIFNNSGITKDIAERG